MNLYPFCLSWFWEVSVLQRLWSHLRKSDKYIQSGFQNFLFVEVTLHRLYDLLV